MGVSNPDTALAVGNFPTDYNWRERMDTRSRFRDQKQTNMPDGWQSPFI